MFKSIIILFFDNNIVYNSGIFFYEIFDIVYVYILPFTPPNFYIGYIGIKTIVIVSVHALLYWTFFGMCKIPRYILFIFCLHLMNYYLYSKFGYLKTKPGLFNLFFHLWDLGKVLIVNNGILPFLIFIYRNESDSSKI